MENTNITSTFDIELSCSSLWTPESERQKETSTIFTSTFSFLCQITSFVPIECVHEALSSSLNLDVYWWREGQSEGSLTTSNESETLPLGFFVLLGHWFQTFMLGIQYITTHLKHLGRQPDKKNINYERKSYSYRRQTRNQAASSAMLCTNFLCWCCLLFPRCYSVIYFTSAHLVRAANRLSIHDKILSFLCCLGLICLFTKLQKWGEGSGGIMWRFSHVREASLT